MMHILTKSFDLELPFNGDILHFLQNNFRILLYLNMGNKMLFRFEHRVNLPKTYESNCIIFMLYLSELQYIYQLYNLLKSFQRNKLGGNQDHSSLGH